MDKAYLIDKFCDVQDENSPRKRVIACRDWLVYAVRYVFEKQGYEQPEGVDLKELLWNPVFASYVGDIDFIKWLDSVREDGEQAMQGISSVSEQDAFFNFDTVRFLIHYLLDRESDPSLTSIRDKPIPGSIKLKNGKTIILEDGGFCRPVGIHREKEPQELLLSQRVFNIRLEILYQLQNANCQQDEWCDQFYVKLKAHLHSVVYRMKLAPNHSNAGEHCKYLDKYAEEETWNYVTQEMICEIRQHVSLLIPSGWGDGHNADLFNLRMHHIEHALLTEGNLQSVPSNVLAARQMVQYIFDEEVCDYRVIGYARELMEFISDEFWESPSVSDIESKRAELARIMFLYKDSGQSISVDEKEDISVAGYVKKGL